MSCSCKNLSGGNSLSHNAQQIMAELRRQMNGAVSQTMRELGQQDYINLGVSLPTIKQIAQGFGTDHPLACELSDRRVREARIAALYIADPELLTIAQADAWSNNWNNHEIARLSAMLLLHHSPLATELADRWLPQTLSPTPTQPDFRRTAALYIIGKICMKAPAELIERVIAMATDEAADIFALREIYINREEFRTPIAQLAEGIEELKWQIE